eukprot:jgi/Chrzof1/12568/UNPLg00521.t1
MPVTAVNVDHIVLRVKDPLASVDWYRQHLGLQPLRTQEYKDGKVPFPSVRITPTFLIDFMKRETLEQHEPVQRNQDHFCLVVDATDMEEVRRTLEAEGVPAEKQFDGFIVTRFGAQGTAMSIYVRDPDDNVVELRTYASKQPDADAKCT